MVVVAHFSEWVRLSFYLLVRGGPNFLVLLEILQVDTTSCMFNDTARTTKGSGFLDTLQGHWNPKENWNTTEIKGTDLLVSHALRVVGLY